MGREKDEKLLISVIKQYYELGLSQEAIAEKEYISKSAVSRLIKKAEEKGYVKVELTYPIRTLKELEDKIREYFPVKSVTVAPVYVEDAELVTMDVLRALLRDLKTIVEDNNVIALSWGRTMEYCSRLLDEFKFNRKGISVVQLNGNAATNILSTKSTGVVERFQEAFMGAGYLFPVPIWVDDESTAHALMNDSRVRPVMDIARNADIAILSIGRMHKKSLVFERGVLSEDDYSILKASGAVGDICSRYFNESGIIANDEVDRRVLGLTLEELKKIPHRLVAAVGEEKAQAIIGALHTGVVDHLYIDEKAAHKVIDLMEA